jgi:hypothetical protein
MLILSFINIFIIFTLNDLLRTETVNINKLGSITNLPNALDNIPITTDNFIIFQF